ncbi:hypothetical protein K1719_020896 [Acacia pycnantha]|nr:hypothetical protein K1719_020896 [Acacia pycnantha]
MSNCFVGYLRKPACFIVFDDLRVMPSHLNTTLWILHNLGIEYAPEKLTVYVTEKEVLDLLKFSLWSETPLTDLFLRKKLHIQDCQNCETPLEFKFEMNEVEIEEDWKIKIVRSKSQGKILFAEADDEFTDQIFSFLSETLGVIESLEEGNADDLSVTPFSSSSALSFLGECKVGKEDIEVRHISIGSDEVLLDGNRVIDCRGEVDWNQVGCIWTDRSWSLINVIEVAKNMALGWLHMLQSYGVLGVNKQSFFYMKSMITWED